MQMLQSKSSKNSKILTKRKATVSIVTKNLNGDGHNKHKKRMIKTKMALMSLKMLLLKITPFIFYKMK